MVTTTTYGALSTEGGNLGPRKSIFDVVKTFSHIGFISFGGTAANIGLFRSILVGEGYVTEEEFTEMFALAQCLPGPSASQVLTNGVITATNKIYIGILAFTIYMIPAAVVMTLFGCLVRESVNDSSSNSTSNLLSSPLLKTVQTFVGLAATSVIGVSAYEIASKLVVDKTTRTVFALTCVFMVGFPSIWWLTPLCLLIGGTITFLEAHYFANSQPLSDHHRLYQSNAVNQHIHSNSGSGALESRIVLERQIDISKNTGIFLLVTPWVLFFACLLLEMLIMDKETILYYNLHVASIFLRVGMLVYGGGPVVVPLLLTQLVPVGLLTQNQFILGFSLVSLLPGPMFSLSAYCGAVIGGPLYALICWACMNLPGISMSVGALPLWGSMRESMAVQQALRGVNASAAGLMTSAFIDLWLKLVKEPPPPDTPNFDKSEVTGTPSEKLSFVSLDASTLAAVVIAFMGMQAALGYTSARVIITGLAIGVLVGLLS